MEIRFEEVLKVSYSRIKCWRSCHKKHDYRYNQKLRKRKKPLALFIGTAIHSCIEEYREGRNWKAYFQEFEKEFNKLFREERADLGDLPSELLGIMEGYFHYYSEDGLIYPKRRWGISSEIPVKVWLDPKTLFVGYVDAYPQDSEGRNWIMDHKSFTRAPDEASRYTDYQFTVYHWLLPQLGYPKADGIIWDYVRKKAPSVPEVLKSGKLSMAKNQDTTYDVYMAKARMLFGDSAQEYEEFAKENFSDREDRFYRRVYLPDPSPTLVGNVVDDLMATIEDIRLRGTSTVRSPTRDCGQCEYFGLCSAEFRGIDTTYMRKIDFQTKGEEYAEEEVAPE